MFFNLECHGTSLLKSLVRPVHVPLPTTRGSGSEMLLGTREEEKQKYGDNTNDYHKCRLKRSYELSST